VWVAHSILVLDIVFSWCLVMIGFGVIWTDREEIKNLANAIDQIQDFLHFLLLFGQSAGLVASMGNLGNLSESLLQFGVLPGPQHPSELN
tara:strand:+ start:290 stop:559 length:270 start_codon:yes stop_codon:yes gene_type:complete